MDRLSTTEIIFIIYILWDVVKKILVEKNADLRENTKATVENTVHIKNIQKQLESLLRLPYDVNQAHTKIRIIEERLKSEQEPPIS